jgi:hypothetical protein
VEGALPDAIRRRYYSWFRKLVRGKVKSNPGKYISRGKMIGQKGKDHASVPRPQIEIPDRDAILGSIKDLFRPRDERIQVVKSRLIHIYGHNLPVAQFGAGGILVHR